MDELAKAIHNKEAKIVIIGLGYVGLPVACMFAKTGFQVVGIRRDAEKVAQINRGICPIRGKEPGLAELLAEAVQSGRLKATTDYAHCQGAQVALVAVETPVDEKTKKPKYKALSSALRSLGSNMSPGTLVIIESTVAPRTMELVVQPVLEETCGLEANQDFYLAHCPERVMPGRLLHNIEHMPRVVGGMTPEAAQLAVELYKHIVKADLDATDCLTAEIVKTTENAYRDVQIAFANEIALLCESLGPDVWEVRELVKKCPYRDMHLPGAGVGGHCLPKDPWLLIANAPDSFEVRLIPAARAVNDGMPLHMAGLTVEALQATGREVAGSRVGVLGYAYLEDSDDTRNSPSEALVARLHELGAEVVIHDPWVAEYQGDVMERLKACDAAVVMVAHRAYRALDPAAIKSALCTPILIDGRRVFDAAQARAVGLVYHGVGQGEGEGESCLDCRRAATVH